MRSNHILRIVKFHRDKVELMVLPGQGGRGNGSSCLMGRVFISVWDDEVLEMDGVDDCITL